MSNNTHSMLVCYTYSEIFCTHHLNNRDISASTVPHIFVYEKIFLYHDTYVTCVSVMYISHS